MEQLTLEQAADNYIYPNNRFHGERIHTAFRAGAKWQKEQLIIKFTKKLEGVTNESTCILIYAIIDELKQD